MTNLMAASRIMQLAVYGLHTHTRRSVWYLQEQIEILEGRASHLCQFVRYKSHMDWTGIEYSLQRWGTEDWPNAWTMAGLFKDYYWSLSYLKFQFVPHTAQ